MAKTFLDSQVILEKIDDFEDYIERLYLSNQVSYDETFHKEVIKRYGVLVNDISNSDLSTEDKSFMAETVTQLFEEYKSFI